MSSKPRAVEPAPPQETLFRFRLRSMLLYMGLLSLLFGLMSAVGGKMAVGILLVAFIVAAHVLSTFVGTRLRDRATAEYSQSAASGVQPPEQAAAVAARRSQVVAAEKQRSRQLQGRGSLLPRLLWLLAAGSLAGAGIYAAIVVEFLWPKVGVAAILAGGVAAGILSAWVVFLAYSFYLISRRAWREAVDPAAYPVTHQTATAGTVPNRL